MPRTKSSHPGVPDRALWNDFEDGPGDINIYEAVRSDHSNTTALDRGGVGSRDDRVIPGPDTESRIGTAKNLIAEGRSVFLEHSGAFWSILAPPIGLN